ncbi:hypothetical protein LOK49_LG08G00410 [Camellia lanceoleosa]|uniref:Uncharacterized protein n=1 Tax=Camellia lanceoleosa TaxID=1840588 RepID=A0ACC0GU85_9ERIC|nr:hypothetical protein LOK49_LG08G00410 [Camellia lanceoleosa]
MTIAGSFLLSRELGIHSACGYNYQPKDAWCHRLLYNLSEPKSSPSSRCNVFQCRSFLVPSEGIGIPVLKTAATLTRDSPSAIWADRGFGGLVKWEKIVMTNLANQFKSKSCTEMAISISTSNHAIWEEIERSESYLVSCMYEEATSIASSVLRDLCHNKFIKAGEETQLNDMLESASMVLVQSLKELRRTQDILNELLLLFGSVTDIPVQVLLAGVCFQISEGPCLGTQEFLEEFLSKWRFLDERYYVLASLESNMGYMEGSGGSFGSFLLGVDKYLEVVEVYVVTLLGMVGRDIDHAICWVEKATLPEEKRQDLLRRLHSLYSPKAHVSSQGSIVALPEEASHIKEDFQKTSFVNEEGFGGLVAACLFLSSEPSSCCSTRPCCNPWDPLMVPCCFTGFFSRRRRSQSSCERESRTEKFWGNFVTTKQMATQVEPPNGIKSVGKHYFSMWQTLFEIDTKYVPIKPIGRGAYGIVCSSINRETNEKVAIKKIHNVFDNRIDALRTLRELKLLRHLRHENVIALKDVMMPIHRRTFKDVYLVYELMDTDLHQIIKSSQALTNDHCQYFLFQREDDIEFIDNPKARKYIKSLPCSPGTPFSCLYPNAHPLAIDLLQKMLVFDPTKRIGVTEALQHPYMSSLYDQSSDPPAQVPIDLDIDEDLREEMIREMMWNEMLHHHPEAAPASVEVNQ